jgi:hypothetical protein
VDSSRTDFVFLALKGTLVTAVLSSGLHLEGILDTRHNNRINLRLVRQWKAGEEATEHSAIDFALADLVSLTAPSVNFAEATGLVGFATDTDISGKSGLKSRELAKWDGGDVEMGGLEEGPPGSWDQFELNERLFGIRTSFDEAAYTTVIDRSSAEYQRLEEDAARLAAEIEIGSRAAGTKNIHLAEERGLAFDDSQVDEEDRYGAVVRSTEERKERDSKDLNRDEERNTANNPNARPISPVSYRQAAMVAAGADKKSPASNAKTSPLTDKAPVVTMPKSTSSSIRTSPPPLSSEVIVGVESTGTQKPRKSIASLQEPSPEALSHAMGVVESTTRRMSQVADLEDQRRREEFERQKRDTAQQFKEFSNRLSIKISSEGSPASTQSTISPSAKLNPQAAEFVPTVTSKPYNPYAAGFVPHQQFAYQPYYNPYAAPVDQYGNYYPMSYYQAPQEYQSDAPADPQDQIQPQ